MGHLAMTRVTLRPEVQFDGVAAPTREQVDAMHDEAHAACYIARSVCSTVHCQPVFAAGENP